MAVSASDFNNDGWTDLYITNDFYSPDFLYMNNQDGTFREVVKESTSHTAFYGNYFFSKIDNLFINLHYKGK